MNRVCIMLMEILVSSSGRCLGYRTTHSQHTIGTSITVLSNLWQEIGQPAKVQLQVNATLSTFRIQPTYIRISLFFRRTEAEQWEILEQGKTLPFWERYIQIENNGVRLSTWYNDITYIHYHMCVPHLSVWILYILPHTYFTLSEWKSHYSFSHNHSVSVELWRGKCCVSDSGHYSKQFERKLVCVYDE